MNIRPFSSIRAGASITPGDPLSVGSYEISVVPGGKGTRQYPNTDRVLSGKFFPLNQDATLASPTRNLLKLSLTGSGIQTTSPHDYWYCYAGWNTTGLDPDGVSVTASQEHTCIIGLYNGTSYSIKWAITNTELADGDAFDATFAGAVLHPGAAMVMEGPQVPVYYYNGTPPYFYSYDWIVGVAALGTSYLHAVCIDTGGAKYSYNIVSGEMNTGGYFEVVLVQTPPVSMPFG